MIGFVIQIKATQKFVKLAEKIMSAEVLQELIDALAVNGDQKPRKSGCRIK